MIDLATVSTRFDITREELETWKRRKAVVLHYSVVVFKQSVRIYSRVYTTYGKPLRDVRYNYQTGQSVPGSCWIYKTMTQATMETLLAHNADVFKIHVTSESAAVFLGNTMLRF
jgi:hypothetical protein